MKVRVILVKPEDFRNVGAVVRVAAFFGVERVAVVRDEDLTADEEAAVRVASAGMVEDIMMLRVASIAEAAERCDVLLGATARVRKDFEVSSPETAFGRVRLEGAQEVGVLFGRESTGLQNDELALCRGGIRIAGAKGRSLNLGHAAAVVLHEASRDGSEENVAPAGEGAERMEGAAFTEIEAFADRVLAGATGGPMVHREDLVRFLVKAGASGNDLALLQNLIRRNSRA